MGLSVASRDRMSQLLQSVPMRMVSGAALVCLLMIAGMVVVGEIVRHGLWLVDLLLLPHAVWFVIALKHGDKGSMWSILATFGCVVVVWCGLTVFVVMHYI